MDAAWIDSAEGLAGWIARLGGGPLAIDTEADSFHHYREKVCLVQLSAHGSHALYDPLASPDLSALAAPLGERRVRKILHGADYDVRLLTRDFGLVIAGLTDTMVAARLTGEPALGLAALLEKHLGVSLDKAHQKADWSRRPLPPALRAYAVEDTRHLERLASILDERLDELGRTAWMREECERIEAVRWRDRGRDEAEPFRRVKGASGLDRASLAVLRELWSWRDDVARKRDRPHFRVLRDEALLAIVAARPESASDLAGVAGMPDALVRSSAASDIVEAVARGLACPEDARPEPHLRVWERLPAAVESRIKRIKTARDALARNLALDPSVLAPRGVVEEMARRWEAGEDPFEAADLRRWQAELLRAELRPA